jgi:uncharacterized protein involved in outer membrane biogenesis
MPRLAVFVLGGVVGAILLVWVVLNFLLADPRYGTPAINWALHTFASKDANVGSGKLRQPFSDTFDIAHLNWPDRAVAREFHLSYNLLGFLPSVPWAKAISVADGQFTVGKPDKNEKSDFQPQKYVDLIEARNLELRFVRAEAPGVVTILTANGSLAKGTARAVAEAGDNHLSFDGLASAGGGSGLKGRFSARGQNLKDLAALVGATAPDTPPFNIKGEISSAPHVWTADGINGKLGDSDIAGQVKVDLGQKKPFLDVALTSANLDFDDLGVVFGIPIGTGKGETDNAEQRKAKAMAMASPRMIPDARIDLSRLRAVNAKFTFSSPKVTDAPAGVHAVDIEGTLRDQVLDFTKAKVQMAGGAFDAKLTMDATRNPAVTKAKGSIKGASISNILNTQLIHGDVSGVFNVTLTGNGFRDAFGSMTGEVGVWSPNSELSKVATEAAGLDIGEVLLKLVQREPGKKGYLKSRCLAAAAQFRNGEGVLNPAVLDNSDSMILAKGGLNLKDESLRIEIEAHPKDISIGTLKGNAQIVGTLKKPGIKVIDKDTVFQVVLAAIAGPLSALPFVELGKEQDAPCQALLADAKAAGDGRLAKAPPQKEPQKPKGRKG